MTVRKKFYPWAATLPKKVSVNLATLFGLGNLKAPGTWGSAAGVLFYWLVFSGLGGDGALGFFRYILFAALLTYLAVGICDAAERAIGMRDPGKIILDEFVAMNFCFLPLSAKPYSAFGLLLGFGLFRFFDIKKPLGISKLQSLEGGLGCVADDIAAAIVSCIALNAAALAVPTIYA